MQWQLYVYVSLAVGIILFFFLQRTNGCTDTKFEQLSLTYTASDIIETVKESSRLQCARRTSFHEWWAAMEYEEETSTCTILQSATVATELTNMNQYIRTTCPGGWNRLADACYVVTPSIHTWDDCKNICAGYGNSHLVSDTSVEESIFIETFDYASIWTGGKILTLGNGNAGTWDNGDTWGYTNWAPGQPDEDGYCIHYYHLGWGDLACQSFHHCMCEKKLL